MFMLGFGCGIAAYWGFQKYGMPKLKELKEKYFK